MAEFNLTVIPVGKVKGEDLEPAIGRMVKVLRRPVELRGSISVPKGTEDPERGQHRAADLMNRLKASVIQLAPGKLIGSDDPEAKPRPRPEALLFITDVDLYTAKTDGVFGALVTAQKIAITSIRRIREAFYRRPADLGKQRSRLIKEMLRMAGRLQGLPACQDPQCVLAPNKTISDIDSKAEAYCRKCSAQLFEGKVNI